MPVFTCISPIDDGVLATRPFASDEDVIAAVAAARDAFDNGPWVALSSVERISYLKRMADHLRARESEIAKAWSNSELPLISKGWGLNCHTWESSTNAVNHKS